MPRKKLYPNRSEANRANALKRWAPLSEAERRVQMEPVINGHTEESRAMAGTAGGWATARGMTKAERRQRGQKGGVAGSTRWAGMTPEERREQTRAAREAKAKKGVLG